MISVRVSEYYVVDTLRCIIFFNMSNNFFAGLYVTAVNNMNFEYSCKWVGVAKCNSISTFAGFNSEKIDLYTIDHVHVPRFVF